MKSPSNKTLLIGIVVAVLVILFVFYFVMPAMKRRPFEHFSLFDGGREGLDTAWMINFQTAANTVASQIVSTQNPTQVQIQGWANALLAVIPMSNRDPVSIAAAQTTFINTVAQQQGVAANSNSYSYIANAVFGYLKSQLLATTPAPKK